MQIFKESLKRRQEEIEGKENTGRTRNAGG
jgi:hypothetical protein